MQDRREVEREGQKNQPVYKMAGICLYLRGLLIQGARNVIYHIRRCLKAGQRGGNPRVEQLLQRFHPNAVAVALANKMARIAWVLLVRNQTWCPARTL